MQPNFDMSAEFEAAFSKRVREQRTRYGLSQRALADALSERGLKLDPSAITRIEKAAEKGEVKRGVRLGEAVVIATELDIDLSEMAQNFDVPESRFGDLIAEAERQSSHFVDVSITLAETLALMAEMIDARPEVLANRTESNSAEYLASVLARIENPSTASPGTQAIEDATHRAAIKKILAALARGVVSGPISRA